MHYVICYDIENDRLRDRVAKTLERNGCHRLQKSVFIAPHLKARDLDVLRQALKRRTDRLPLGARDSIYFIPLPHEMAMSALCLPDNNAYAAVFEKPLKIML